SGACSCRCRRARPRAAPACDTQEGHGPRLLRRRRGPPGDAARDALTFASWGSPLSLAQYLERERRLWRHPFSRGLVRWVLRDGGVDVASCETYAVPVH